MSHLFHSERTHTFAFQVQHRRRAGAVLCEKQCAPTLSLFCRSHRRAQSRLTSAIFASVVLAGSSICRTKCKACGSANPLMESRAGAGQDFILLLWRSMVTMLCSLPALLLATQSPPTAPAPEGQVAHTFHVHDRLTALLLSHVRLWMCR
jgi:hypothetical protein